MDKWAKYDQPTYARAKLAIDPMLTSADDGPTAAGEWQSSRVAGLGVVRWRFLHPPIGGMNEIECEQADGLRFLGSIHITTAEHRNWGRPPTAKQTKPRKGWSLWRTHSE